MPGRRGRVCRSESLSSHLSGFHSFASAPQTDSSRLLPAIPMNRVVPTGIVTDAIRGSSLSSFVWEYGIVLSFTALLRGVDTRKMDQKEKKLTCDE